jgi:peptidoglycan/xylan/chitin deacetylase (PgdA/CDA1 family)
VSRSLGPSVKHMVKSAITRLPMPSPGEPGRRVVVLCYHSVHATKRFATVGPALFDEHLQWLKDNCDLIPFSEVPDRVREASARRPAVSITFDDGYGDNAEVALPILLRHGATADFFVTAGLVERDPLVVQRFMLERGVSLEELQPLDWPAIDDMQRAGMRFGSHTWGHPNLAKTGDARTLNELRRSREHLEARLGRPVRWLAYPYGKPRRNLTMRTMQLAAEAGYDLAAAVLFRTVRATDHPLCLPRFFVARDSVEALSAKVLGKLDLLGAWQEHSPLWASRLVSPQDFTYPG